MGEILKDAVGVAQEHSQNKSPYCSLTNSAKKKELTYSIPRDFEELRRSAATRRLAPEIPE